MPEIVGGLVFCGADGAAVTTAVGADDAVLDPTLFDAVTATRNVEPTSAFTAVYPDDVAPAISAQPAPAESQRRH